LGQIIVDVNEIKIQRSNKPIVESHHIDISIDRYIDIHNNTSSDEHINFIKDDV